MSRWRRWMYGRDARPRARLGRWLLMGGAAILLLTLIGWLSAPPIIEKAVEKSLETMPGGYQGSLERAELRLLSAEVALIGFRIEKKNGKVPVPYLEADQLVLGTVRDGLKGRSVLRLVKPVISFVDAEREAEKQTGPKVDLAQIRKQLPFELTAVHIEDAEVHYRNFEAKPEVDAHLSQLNLDWVDLVGCLPPGNASCRSTLEGEGALMTSGRLALKGRFERKPQVHFDAHASVRALKAPRLNAVFKHYAKVDVQKGEIDLDADFRRRGEQQSALIIPRLSDFEVVGSDAEDTRFFREVGVAAAAGYFERKAGKKAIAMTTKGGKTEFELIDREQPSADRQDR